MSTKLITRSIWPTLTEAARRSRQPCAVAVAYFGRGASRLLPLPANSRLVVDASERAVASGQTCPDDISKLIKKGIKAYSVQNLHAKVFALKNVAFIGSTNVSSHSASRLIEAVIRTTEVSTVRAAQRFVLQNCLHELTPQVLARLARLYQPPKIFAKDRTTKARKCSSQPMLPRVQLAQLKLEEWSEKDQKQHDAGQIVAKRHQAHRRNYKLDSFRYVGTHSYRRGDVVIQVIDMGGGRVLMSPPGNDLHIQVQNHRNKQITFVYLEHPDRRKRQLTKVAKALGRGSLKKLRRNGLVKGASFTQALLRAWS